MFVVRQARPGIRLQPRRCAGADQPADVVSIAELLTLQAVDSNADLLSSPPTPVRDRHEISVSSYGAIRTNCIVPFSVERVGTNIYLCDLLFRHLGSWR